MDDRNQTLIYGAGISAGGIAVFVAWVLSSLFSMRDLIELSLRKRSQGSNTVSSTAVEGVSRIASDLVPRFASLLLIIVALAHVLGYVSSLSSVCDMMPEQPLIDTIPLHVVSVTNTFLIIVYLSVFIVFAR